MNEQELRRLFDAHQASPAGGAPRPVRAWVHDLLDLLFPEMTSWRPDGVEDLRHRWTENRDRLRSILEALEPSLPAPVDTLVDELDAALPGLRAMLLEDADAICQGDPAAVDTTEVIRTYPGFLAIAIYRIAHHLHSRGVPVLPRVLTECAHARTGIDIHPGAEIGERFCIDHGTGIVIGETTSIGRNVKLYQGVTLGALSVSKDSARMKRHPTVEDDVVIYANATILGGDTVVGRGSVIGGSVWLLHSVPPGSRVYHDPDVVVEEPKD